MSVKWQKTRSPRILSDYKRKLLIVDEPMVVRAIDGSSLPIPTVDWKKPPKIKETIERCYIGVDPSGMVFKGMTSRTIKVRDRFMRWLYYFATTYRRRRNLLEHGIGLEIYRYWEVSYQFEYRRSDDDNSKASDTGRTDLVQQG